MREYYGKLRELLEKGAVKRITDLKTGEEGIYKNENLVLSTEDYNQPELYTEEVIALRPTLVLFGFGHIGKNIYKMDSLLDFPLVIFDDRKNILEDKSLYVEIRKDNYANAYYYGGNVALIRWTGGKITAETHRKYLGKSDETDLYQDCTETLHSKEGLELIKENIREEYHKLSKREKTDEQNRVYTSNEKWVQGELKLRFPKRYIDSEFAYRIGWWN